MGNVLSCVKEPRAPVPRDPQDPATPCPWQRLKRKRRDRKRAVPEVGTGELPLDAGTPEDCGLPKKLKASPLRAADIDHGQPLPDAVEPGKLVQVKELPGGHVQTAHFWSDVDSLQASWAEGTAVIARILENPAEQGCHRAVSRLVDLERTRAANSRAVLLPIGCSAEAGSMGPTVGLPGVCHGAPKDTGSMGPQDLHSVSGWASGANHGGKTKGLQRICIGTPGHSGNKVPQGRQNGLGTALRKDPQGDSEPDSGTTAPGDMDSKPSEASQAGLGDRTMAPEDHKGDPCRESEIGHRLQTMEPGEGLSVTSGHSLQSMAPGEEPSATGRHRLQTMAPEEEPSATGRHRLQTMAPGEEPSATGRLSEADQGHKARASGDPQSDTSMTPKAGSGARSTGLSDREPGKERHPSPERAEQGTLSEISTPSPMVDFEKPLRWSPQENAMASDSPYSGHDASVGLDSSGYSSRDYSSSGRDARESVLPLQVAQGTLEGSVEPDRVGISDIYVSGESGDMSAKEKLLLWTQKMTAGYTGVRCTNFSSCWNDGKMFNAIIHRYRPDLVDMERVVIQSNQDNLEQAFEIAERLGVTRLLDSEDVDVPSPDEKSVITYVASLYDAFPKIPEGGEGISATEVDSKWLEYKSRLDSLIRWIKQHTVLMSDKSFPQNPVELKALYNQYVHFKETEIPAKEEEKGRIEKLYKLLEAWIEFGRLQLPPGCHPNDVEEEWAMLIVEMLEREKALRPAVERLELLLQIANKIQNGALSCEEKLTLARNTMQADAAHLESGLPVQHESDVVMYLYECEGLCRILQTDLQILRDEKYFQLEELVFRITRLQDELITLRLECSNLYRKGHFTSSDLLQHCSTGTTRMDPGSQATHPASSSSFRRPMSRTELLAISSSEDEGSLRFIYELLAWVEEMQMKLERAEWGSDLPSVESQLETQRLIHNSVEDLAASLKEARLYEGKMSLNFRSSYSETLGKLETQYCKLTEMSQFRLRNLQSLHDFVSRATTELIWLNEKEEEELSYDWSDNNPNMQTKSNYHKDLMLELEEKRDIIQGLQEEAELLSLQNHPAKQTVEAYSAAVQSQWQWIKQLCLCVDQHLSENTAYFQFFSDMRESETYLRNLQDSIKRKYSCERNTSMSRLEDLLQDSMDEKEQLIQSKSSVASLVGRSKSIVQLKPRNSDHVLNSTLPIKAICDYRQIEITISKNEECVLEDNSHRTKWKVISPTGNEAMVPSACFLVPPPNNEAIELANRVEQLYQKVMSLWHQLHVNTKSLISWNYMRKDIDVVQGWTAEKLRSLAQADQLQVLTSLQSHFEDFLVDSRDCQLFSVADRLHLEEEVAACKVHHQQLLHSMETEDKDESEAKTYMSQLLNIRLHLEECESRLVRRIQTPPGPEGDTGQDSTARIMEQERIQEDLQRLQTDLGDVSHRCILFFKLSPSGSSVPTLRSELDLLVERMDTVYGLSSVYLNKLKTVDVVLRGIQEAEVLVKGFEVRLSQEDAVPADIAAIQSQSAMLKQWQDEMRPKDTVFSSLQQEVSRAKEVAEQLQRLNHERSPDVERYQEKLTQLQERWHNVHSQVELRQSELDSIEHALRAFRDRHGELIGWIDSTTAQQEQMKPGKSQDSRVLSEQLSQQTALVAEIERNQATLDECQRISQQYSSTVKEYELQLMTYRAFVESQQKSPGKRRRMLSSSDLVTQEFMDLRTRYTALVTLTTQHVKYISDALRRLEEEEKVVEEEKQEQVEGLRNLLGWVSGLSAGVGAKKAPPQSPSTGDVQQSITEQQAVTDELASKKEQVTEAIKAAQIFLAKHGQKLSTQEKEHISSQLTSLQETYSQLCSESAGQLQQLQGQLAKEAEQKSIQEQQAVRNQKMEELSSWLQQAENLLSQEQAAAGSGDLSALQQSQSSIGDLQKDAQAQAGLFARTIQDMEEFLEENRSKMSPGELQLLQEKLNKTKERYQALQQRALETQEELKSAVTTAQQQQTEKVKAAEEFEEKQSQIESLMGWMASLKQSEIVSKTQIQPVACGSANETVPDGASTCTGTPASMDQQLELMKAHHQELLSKQQELLHGAQSAQAFLDKHGHSLPPEERQRLQSNLSEMKEQYAASLLQSETQLKQAQALHDELQKFLHEHNEFDAWLQHSEHELEAMHRGGGDPASLQPLLRRQGSFSEDVISHKGDLRYITISGQKVADLEKAAIRKGELGVTPSATDVVKEKLENTQTRYSALHTKCSQLGSHLTLLLDRSKHFQEAADSLHVWLEQTEAALGQILVESVASDAGALQKQLDKATALQGDLAEHQVQVEKMQKAAQVLLEIQGEPAPDQKHVLATRDAILGRFQLMSQQMSERTDHLLKCMAHSQSVQEGVDSLLQWMEGMEKSLKGQTLASISPTTIQEALAMNMKLKQDITSRSSSLDATGEMVGTFAKSADDATTLTLQGKLAEVKQRFDNVCQQQHEQEVALKELLPKAELYEQLSGTLQDFTQSRARMLAAGNSPDEDMAYFCQHIKELNTALKQQKENMEILQQVAKELSASSFQTDPSQHLQQVESLMKEFTQLQEAAKQREQESVTCQQRLADFRRLVASVKKWLTETEGSVPAVDPSMGNQELETRIQQTKALLVQWAGRSDQVEEISDKGTALENLIMAITAPEVQSKTGSALPESGGAAGSVNGYHTCKDLTEIQCHVSDVSQRYDALGSVLQDREEKLLAMQRKIQEVQEETAALFQWLETKEQILSSMDSSPSTAQAEQNKALLTELEQNSGKVEQLKEALCSLLEKYPNSPEAKSWQTMLEDLESRWTKAHQVATSRQQELEESASRLTTFQAAETQLRPWLTEKELMMGVLGPLSIEPNMLGAQKQQVQFMLKEFESRRQQHEQLNQAARGILSSAGDGSSSSSQVQEALSGVNDKWDELTHRLNSRSEHIEQALTLSTRYQDLLRDLAEKVKEAEQKLSAQSALSTQPEVVKQQLQETSELRSEVDALEQEVVEAQVLCDELSQLIGEKYLKDELKKRLDAVALPLRVLEDLAADRMNRLQTTLASSQQFQQMFDELRTWLNGKLSQQAQFLPISAKLDQLQSQIHQQEEFQKSLNQHSGAYEMIVGEGESLLLSAQPGEEKATLQSQLDSLKSHWRELSKQASERQAMLKDCFQKSQKYQQYVQELLPWAEDCNTRVMDLNVSLDPTQLETSLLSAKVLQNDVEKRHSSLEMLNSAADLLIDASQADEDSIREEKARLNQKVDALTEELQSKTASIEEMSQRLKEFKDRFKDIEKKLEGAQHQLEIYEALGPQACSNKNLEKMRTQQETLHVLEPQLDYLKDLALGLVADAPSGSDSSELLHQAESTQQEFSLVKQRVDECCLVLESKLQGIGQFHSHVREMFSQLADWDDEFDGMGAVGRDVDSLQSQIEALQGFLSKLQGLKSDIGHSEDQCRQMLESEASPDLLGLKRELQTLNKQCSKLTERGKNRHEQLETTLARVKDFYSKLKEMKQLMAAAESDAALSGTVASEVEAINQQLNAFKAFQKERVEPLQNRLQQVNGLGQGLIQSADKSSDVHGLEHDTEELCTRWNTLSRKVTERVAQLQEALLHCGKFQDALEPLLSWLTDTEELMANQKPPSAEYKVVKAQIQEQKLLQRLLDDRRATVEMIQAEGGRIAETAEAPDRRKIHHHLESLEEQWVRLLRQAEARKKQLDDILVLAQQFHESVEPISDWLSTTEKKLANSEPIGTQTPKIQQQITRHKALNEEILCRKKCVDQAVKNGQALLKQTTGEEVLLIQEKLDGIKTRYSEIMAASAKTLRTLEQARQLATKFQSTHEELSSWLRKVEEELASCGEQPPVGDQIPLFQERQKELKKEVMEQRLVLDTVNEVSSALLELVPWRAREGLDKLVSEANEQYRAISDTVGQRVDQIDAAIQRSQQYEQAADAELAWVAETKRKLLALGPIRLEQDQTTAQLQVQKAFTIDIIRHKDSMDNLLCQRDEILGACGEEHKAVLQEKTQALLQQYEDISHLNSERYAGLERAQALVAQFWETHGELSPWLEETQGLIELLPPPAVDSDLLRQQQEDMRLLRESIAEHKPHIDKLLKIGPQLQQLNSEEGQMVQERFSTAECAYARIREAVRQRAILLDEAVAQATQFHDKIEPMLESLEALASRMRPAPLIPAEVDKIRECISENKSAGMELEKLQPSFEALKRRGQELIGRSQGPEKDPSAKAIQDKLEQMLFLWGEIKACAEEREQKYLDVLELAGKFWYDMAALLTTLKDTQDIIHDLESPGIDPSLIKQQVEAAEAIKDETDGLHEELEFIRLLGTDLIFACGETEKPEVKKSIDEMNNAWENLNRTWRERLDRLEEAMLSAVQYQDALQAMFDWLDNAVIKLCDMSPVGTDLDTVKDQINEMKEFKVEVYQQQIEMERLSHQGELMLKKATDQTDRDIIKEPVTELRHLWDNLGEKINDRQHTLEAALLALGQFQHALSEVMSWLDHTEQLLDSQRPIGSDPKLIEVELAKHHVLKNDVLAHQNTVETVSDAGNDLLQSSAGDDASSLRNRLQMLNRCWMSVLQKTEEREQQLEFALQQAQGFYGEIEDILQWLIRTESALSASKATGGLPETAREQLTAHMELYAEFKENEEMYRQLLDKGRLMLPSREDPTPESSSEQNVAILERKWQTVSTKMEERKSKLEDALALACEFQNSLQDFINWLTQAEQNLNMAPPASLILDTVFFQIDEHKVFVNEVNQQRDHIIELDKMGNQLKFVSQKQDVVLIKNLLVSVQSRWEKVVQRSVERGRALDDSRKRAKQFHEAWKKLIDWLEDAENRLDSDVEISNDPDKIKVQLTKHKEIQKTLGSKQPVYDTTVRTGRALKDKASLTDDVQKLDHLLGEIRDRWDTVCGKSLERQHKLEEALLFSGQFMDALQALVDWLYKVEPQLAEDQPVHGDLDLVMNLMDVHKGFQKELGKRTSSVQALKRSARELLDTSRDDIAWVKVQLQELSARWDTVCKLSVSKQTRLELALKQAEEFRAAVHVLLEWLSEAEQTLRFRGALPDDVEALQSLINLHKEFMRKVEEKRVDVNTATVLGEEILAVCHPDCVTTIKHWNTIIRARFEEVLTWAKQHQQRLETAHAELMANADLLEELLSWIQWAETTLIQRDQDPVPQNIDQVKALIAEHQSFMEEMTRKQPDVDKITKTYKRKTTEPDKTRSNRKSLSQVPPVPMLSQSETKNPRINQLSARWQQVWLLALERQRKLNDVLDRLEELKEFANFDFDVWRKKYMRWMNHKKSRVMDFFRRIDKDQDGKITRQEFIDGILASKFPTTKLEMTAVADIFDRDGDGYIDYYEFVAALHPNKDAYRPTTDADKIEDEVTRQVAQCKCAKRFQVEQIGENKYRFFLGNQFGDSQQLRLVRILRSTVMVRVGGGWMALDEFLVKNDPCRARGRTNLELREKFILPEGMSQGMTPFRSRGRKSKPSSRTASPTRSSSSASQSNHSCTSMPSSPATPASGAKTPQQPFRGYEKPWLANSKVVTPARGCEFSDFLMPCEVTPQSGKLKKPTFHSSRTSLTGEAAGCATPVSSGAKPSRADPKKTTSRPASHAGSRAGSRASSRRGSDASDFDLLETQSACSDTSESSAHGGHGNARRGASKPSKIPTMSKKITTATPPKTPGTKR